jgi:hypothetical protein
VEVEEDVEEGEDEDEDEVEEEEKEAEEDGEMNGILLQSLEGWSKVVRLNPWKKFTDSQFLLKSIKL